MCLTTKENLPIHTASEDMCVYKVFETTNHKLRAPFFYRNDPYELGAESTTELDGMRLSQYASSGFQICKLTPNNQILAHIIPVTYISGRGFYSFTAMESAMNLIKELLSLEMQSSEFWLMRAFECYECTVPKGARYITDGDTVISDRITPIKRA